MKNQKNQLFFTDKHTYHMSLPILMFKKKNRKGKKIPTKPESTFTGNMHS